MFQHTNDARFNKLSSRAVKPLQRIVAIDLGLKKKRAAFDGKRTVKFSGIEEVVERFPPLVKVFVGSSAPYVFLCKLAEVYDAYCINTQLTERFRLANGLKRTNENDASVLLNIARQHLSGQLSEGVWRFQPDPLRVAVREAGAFTGAIRNLGSSILRLLKSIE